MYHQLLGVGSRVWPVFVAALLASILLLVKTSRMDASKQTNKHDSQCDAGPVSWCNNQSVQQLCHKERSCGALGATVVANAPNKHPRNRDWFPLQSRWVQEARQKGSNVTWLFLGDSLTEAYRGTSLGIPHRRCRGIPATFRQHFADALAFGISGDEVQNLIWRLLHGEVDEISPKVVVVHIGTNNLHLSKMDGEGIFFGLSAVLQYLLWRLPESHVVVLGLLPRGRPREYVRDIAKANSMLQTWTSDKPRLQYVDCGRLFVRKGEISSLLMPDFLHPSPQGCKLLFHCILKAARPVGEV